MADLLGWLLDLYEDAQDGAVLWLLGDDGGRHCLHQEFPITFYAAGSSEALRELWVWLRAHPLRPELKREQRRDLFAEDPVTVLAVTVRQPALQPRLFHEMAARWPNLDYYDADLEITLRHAALYNTFPLARCYARTDEGGRIQELTPPRRRCACWHSSRTATRRARNRGRCWRSLKANPTASHSSRSAPYWSTCAPCCGERTRTCC